jgi:hypothetical protein
MIGVLARYKQVQIDQLCANPSQLCHPPAAAPIGGYARAPNLQSTVTLCHQAAWILVEPRQTVHR